MNADKATEPGLDPVGMAVIEALARRAAAQQGAVQQLLLLRIEQLRAEHGAARPCATLPEMPEMPEMPHAGLAALSQLVDQLGRARALTGTPAPLKAVAAFKPTWSRLRAEQRLRQALAEVPAQAGPLNSSHVVHLALQAMHELSPEYLDAFMSHVEALLWLEQAAGRTPGPVRAEAARRPGTRPARRV